MCHTATRSRRVHPPAGPVRGYLQVEQALAGALQEIGDRARGQPDQEGPAVGLLGVGAQEVGAQHVVLQQGRAGVTGEHHKPNTTNPSRGSITQHRCERD